MIEIAKGFPIAPKARLADGFVDIVMVKVSELLGFPPKFHSGSQQERNLEFLDLRTGEEACRFKLC